MDKLEEENKRLKGELEKYKTLNGGVAPATDQSVAETVGFEEKQPSTERINRIADGIKAAHKRWKSRSRSNHSSSC